MVKSTIFAKPCQVKIKKNEEIMLIPCQPGNSVVRNNIVDNNYNSGDQSGSLKSGIVHCKNSQAEEKKFVQQAENTRSFDDCLS